MLGVLFASVSSRLLVDPIVGTSVARADYVTFWVATAIVILGALGVVGSRHPVHAALSLVFTLFGIAVLFVEEGAGFLAAVQVIVYAGAIVVLFLFVIMFLGVDRMENLSLEPLRGQRLMAAVLGICTTAVILIFGFHSHWDVGASSVSGPDTQPGVSEVALLGKSVFTTYLFAFEATAGLLVIAVVGAVILSRRGGPAGGGTSDDEVLSNAAAGPKKLGDGSGGAESDGALTGAGPDTDGEVGADGDGEAAPAAEHRIEEVAG